MTRILTIGLVAVLGGAVMGQPVAAQNREHQQIAAETRMLQEQTQQLAITLAVLNESLKAINARLDDASEDSRRAFADQKLLIDNVANDVRVVRERTDDNNLRIATLREEIDALRLSVVEMQQAVVAAAAAMAPPVDPDAPPVEATTGESGFPLPPPPAVTLPPTAGLSPTRMLEQAKADYFGGQYSLAITGFQQFLMAFPGSDSAGEARHYIGEAYAAQNQWADAILAYSSVVRDYPNSSFVPEAYYKRGIAQERSGLIDAARASWETAVTAFPESDGGRLARQSLDRLDRQRQP